jgi:2,4-dienoyl-CoA reductase-like NADH-dependent reductase (Old Yellow Enzyme family)
MSNLFDPRSLGKVEVKNVFIHSATYEAMADSEGKVTDKLLQRYERLAKGGVGLIIPGYCFVMPNGRSMHYQTSIHNDSMIDGLKRLVDIIHINDGKIVFQLAHSGRQTTKDKIGQTQIAPSKGPMDTVYLARAKEMSESDIKEVINAFGNAANRAQKAGADGVQIHAAHGYLVNQFLSPFFNRRTDSWGGTDENRFKFIQKVILKVKENISDKMILLVKLNTQDFTPKDGITLPLARQYAKWLSELPIDGLELSCGTISFSMFNMVRGNVPTEEMVYKLPLWRKVLGKRMLRKMEGGFDLEEGYNIEAAKQIKPVIGKIPLMVVGGIRSLEYMEKAIKNGYTDFISMSRPFIKEPNVIQKFKDGKINKVSCVSCNRCFAAIANDLPVACYENNFPIKVV